MGGTESGRGVHNGMRGGWYVQPVQLQGPVSRQVNHIWQADRQRRRKTSITLTFSSEALHSALQAQVHSGRGGGGEEGGGWQIHTPQIYPTSTEHRGRNHGGNPPHPRKNVLRAARRWGIRCTWDASAAAYLDELRVQHFQVGVDVVPIRSERLHPRRHRQHTLDCTKERQAAATRLLEAKQPVPHLSQAQGV